MLDQKTADDSKIVLFSAKKTEQVVQKDNEVQSTIQKEDEIVKKVDDFKGTEESQQKLENNVVQKIENVQSVKEDVVASQKTPETKSFKVNEQSFSEDEPGKATTEIQEKAKETEPISEQAVLSFLKEKGIEVSTINDLSKKEVLSEPVLEFKKFNEKTGRGIEAFINSKKEWEKVSEDETIKEFYRYSEPNLSEEDIQNELDLIKLTQDERDEMSEREIKLADQNYRKTYAKALAFMKNVSKEYSLPAEEKKIEKKALSEEEIAKAYRPYWEKRDKSLSKLNDISIKVADLGDIKLPITQTHKDLIAKATQTQEDYFGRWLMKDGSIDTDRVSIDVAFSIPEIRNELHSEMISQIYNLLKEEESKKRRNVTLDGGRVTADQEGRKGVITFNSKNEQTNSRMGQPLIPPRK